MATPNNVVYALEKSLLFADPSLVEEEDLRDVALMAREDGELDCIDSEIHLVVERCSNVLFCCQQEESLAKEVKATILGQFLSDQQLTVEVLSTYFDLIMRLDYADELVAEFDQEIKDVDIREMHPSNFQSLLSSLYRGVMKIFTPV